MRVGVKVLVGGGLLDMMQTSSIQKVTGVALVVWICQLIPWIWVRTWAKVRVVVP